MKNKTKIFGTVLLCGALVLAFTACAGCTGDNSVSKTNDDAKPLVGTYVTSLLLIEIILDFHSDFTVDIVSIDSLTGTVSKTTTKYWSNGDNEYCAGEICIQVSDDSNVISVKGIEGESGSLLFNKFSNYKIPTPSPTQTPIPTQAPISSGSVGNFVDDKYGDAKCWWGVTDCIRGDEANKIIAKGNKNNKVPESGYEYLLCYYSLRTGDTTTLQLQSTNPFILTANGDIVERQTVTLPNGYHTFGVGNFGGYEGWIAYIIPVSSTVKTYLANNHPIKDSPYIRL